MAKKKLTKTIEGNVVTIAEGTTGKTMSFDFGQLPKEIQSKFGPFGLGHKLGDSAAGKEGVEATEAIEAVWKGLMSGEWSTRAPAGEKISKVALNEKLGTLSEKEQEAAKKLLAKMGITL